MKTNASPNDAPRAAELVEESLCLLLRASPSAWLIYLAGAVPWVLGLGHFWAAASWFSPRPAELAWRALGLTALYLWLKVAQAWFCARLRADRIDAEPPPLGWAALRFTLGRQARSQGWAVPVMPVAAVLSLPLGFAWTYFENLTALAASPDVGGESLERRARREALRWPGPAHIAMLLFSGLWLCVWVNIASGFFVIPWLARTLLGVENMFGLSGWWALNSTFLALVTILTWLAVDPLVKAYHVLRTFYGETRHTGEDLRLELRRAPSAASPAAGRAVRNTLALLALCALGGWGGAGGPAAGLHAQEAPVAVADLASDSISNLAPATPDALASEFSPELGTTPAEIDAALDAALRGRDFLWRLHPLPVPEDESAEDGFIKGLVREAVETIIEMARATKEWLEGVADWFENLFKKKDRSAPKPKTPRSAGDIGALARVLLYGLLGLCLLALLWLLWASWKQQRPPPRPLSASAAATPPPDLNDENLEASRLPSNEWLDLARRQIALGEWRLALRALYLATLAGLGARGLVTLARAKTNLDYERELGRRAAGRSEVIAGFRGRRLVFERVWYGRALAGEAEVRAWLTELERDELQAPSPLAPPPVP